jgi:hydroxypyruvate isomerase
MERRNFLAAGLAAALAATTGAAQQTAPVQAGAASSGAKFKLKYAPRLMMFTAHAGKDPLDNLKFIADQGFTAVYDLGLAERPDAEKIVGEAARLGLTVGVFSARSKTDWALDDDAVRQENLKTIQKAMENAKRLNIEGALLVPGNLVPGMTMEQMTANVIKNLKYVAERVDFGGKMIVMEPLNPRNHPGKFLTKIAQGVEICKAVGAPGLKLVDDLYHQQITEGDLIPNIDQAWDYIGTFHLGDTPGRNEPLTGEINFRNIFKHIHDKGYQGLLCMEHGLSIKAGGGKKKKGKAGAAPNQDAQALNRQGEERLIKAYRWCDAFEQPIA